LAYHGSVSLEATIFGQSSTKEIIIEDVKENQVPAESTLRSNYFESTTLL